ncbi:hypothetical protein L1987_44146 [Smallanthus sonchifolius]|uniref:Uncharacterized protein n=1 Tax=Smallanthus sonchifolius TaxID=185202 RepID=A0ACB9GQP1_9ASTR|nr:hypothetical protein L1987_44146 [Smallanthus sonchifolius]
MEVNQLFNFMSSSIDGTSLSRRIPDFIRYLRWLREKLIRFCRLLNPGDDRILQSKIAYLCEPEYRSLSRDCC